MIMLYLRLYVQKDVQHYHQLAVLLFFAASRKPASSLYYFSSASLCFSASSQSFKIIGAISGLKSVSLGSMTLPSDIFKLFSSSAFLGVHYGTSSSIRHQTLPSKIKWLSHDPSPLAKTILSSSPSPLDFLLFLLLVYALALDSVI